MPVTPAKAQRLKYAAEDATTAAVEETKRSDLLRLAKAQLEVVRTQLEGNRAQLLLQLDLILDNTSINDAEKLTQIRMLKDAHSR